MENVIYNELLHRGFSVDVGVIPVQESDALGKQVRKQLEVDFVANKGSQRYYIQSDFEISSKEKMQVLMSLADIFGSSGQSCMKR